MNAISFSMERAALRFGIDGDWTADEFSSFLRDTSETYSRINSLFILREAIDAEVRFNQQLRAQSNYEDQVFTWHSELFGRYLHHPTGMLEARPSSFERILELTRAVSQPLMVDSISYASPGWMQFIGDMNPLKVLADFITKWRAENTKRDANRMKFEIERARIQAELAAKLLEAAPKMEKYHEGGTSRLIDMAESVIKPATGYVQRVGTDSRIVDAVLARPSETLPQPRLPE